ncbi:MAG: polyphosphate kinase 1 [Planctomycetota bacterium]|nr:polyphosphate kinase 1 [Planctomycetota bacterium]MDA1138705.1 polyphosphate kinase 1 [Planctomycetota bacterium]
MNQKFFNRELAWLEFNWEVLEEALDPEVPLFDRLFFLSVVANNLDEFFMVRVAGLKRDEREGMTERCPAGMTPREQLKAISDRAHEQVNKTYLCLNESVGPAAAEQGLKIQRWKNLSESERHHLEYQFHEDFFPVLTPMGIDFSHPFPLLQNLSINLCVLLERNEEDEHDRLAIVPIPSVLPRFVELPTEEGNEFVPLEEIVRQHLSAIFPGQKILDTVVLRITRDSELDLDGDAPSLLAEVEREVRNRRSNNPVRLELESSIQEGFLQILKDLIKLEDEDVYLVPGFLALSALSELAFLPGYDDHHFQPQPPQPVQEFEATEDIWEAIRKGDILLHHPFQSFDPVVELLKTAAADPDVLAIKQTLYRTSRNSPIIKALTDAALAGKQVCVLIELMARFDEERNIQGARRLEEAGAHVIWGIMGLKTHAKICLIVRREPSGIRRYVHLGTGNYNERTAKLYTDYGVLTASDTFGRDASSFFNALTGYSDIPEFHHVIMAPYQLRDRLLFLVNREVSRAQDGLAARITLKMNSLADPTLIESLYHASQAGVKIRCNVRGICCLRPGVSGLSENIRVVSIIDRYLEHARVYHFHNGGNDEVYLSSADWMPRNLDRRIELLFPLVDPDVKQKVMENLEIYFGDNRSARVLQKEGSYIHMGSKGEPELRSQAYFYDQARRQGKSATARPPLQLVPKERAKVEGA